MSLGDLETFMKQLSVPVFKELSLQSPSRTMENPYPQSGQSLSRSFSNRIIHACKRPFGLFLKFNYISFAIPVQSV